MKLNKKKLALFLSVALLTNVLAGCSSASNTTTTSTTATGTQIYSVTNDVPFVNLKWQPFVYSEFYRETLGEQVQMDFEKMVDAIMTGTTQIEVSEEFMANVKRMIPPLFPPYYQVVSDATYSEGILTLTYYDDREEVLNGFGKRVEEIINNSVCEGDTDIMKALAIYNYLTPRFVYDYSAVGDVYADVTPYRALLNYEGICQSFAAAFTYLCLQEGLNATVAQGINESIENHEWSMVMLDGEWYYFDPTFDQALSSLKYFGFTKNYRAEVDEYPLAWQDVGLLEIYLASDFDGIDDTRFEYLNILDSEVTLERKNGQMIVSGKSTTEDKTYQFVIE